LGAFNEQDQESRRNKLNKAAVESRTDTRIPYIHPVNYMVIGQFLHISSGIAFQATILNISGGGMLIRTDVEPCREEMMVRAWIPLPHPSRTVPVIAVMRWVKDKDQNVFDIGFEFVL
jgi:hypothetical protein